MRECTADADLAPEEIEYLNALPDAAHQAPQVVSCELKEGHAGPHQGLAQSDDRGQHDYTNWWLRWSAAGREWTHEPCCYLGRETTAELCMLPEGHEGAHAFA